MEEQPSVADRPPPIDGDGGGRGGSPNGGEPLSDVDDGEDDPSESEGVQAPRMSGRENRVIPLLRLIEIMVAVNETDDGGACVRYEEVKSFNDNEVCSIVDRLVGKEVVQAR